MDKTILQYKISDWHQLVKCQSNTSPDLKIGVTDFLNNDEIAGIRISVNHPKYGSLFSILLGDYCYGSLVSPIAYSATYATRDCETDIVQIVQNQLERFGFYITYSQENYLSKPQVEFLRAVNAFNMDKLRLVSVHDDIHLDDTQLFITAFNVEHLPAWIQTGYSPGRSEWSKAISEGYAINVSALCKNPEFKWDWMYNNLIDLPQLLEKYEVNNE